MGGQEREVTPVLAYSMGQAPSAAWIVARWVLLASTVGTLAATGAFWRNIFYWMSKPPFSPPHVVIGDPLLKAYNVYIPIWFLAVVSTQALIGFELYRKLRDRMSFSNCLLALAILVSLLTAAVIW
jgi:hypothetical protein